MEMNPYAAPQAEVEGLPEAATGLRMPFEDAVTYPVFGQRVTETFRWLAADMARAGEGLRNSQTLGAPIGFFALFGLAPTMLIGILSVLFPPQPIWQVWMDAPRTPAPSGFLLVGMLAGVVVAGPIGSAIGILIAGLVDHAGLWILRGTQEGFGLLVTFRSVLYASAVISCVLAPFQLLGQVPGRFGSYMALIPLLLQAGGVFYYGIVLARAHRTDTWRGVLGVWLPLLLVGGLAAACIGTLWFAGGDTFQRAFLQGLRGGK